MLVFPVLPVVDSSPAQPPFEAAALDLCRRVAVHMGMDGPPEAPGPERLKALQAQAEVLLASARRSLPGDSLVPPLLEAALGALQVLSGQEEPGARRYGFAAREAALRWAELRRGLPADSPARAEACERLAVLTELAGLRGIAWQEEALRLRARLAKGPDPDLERDLAAAVEDRYGPWLTVAELEPMVEDSRELARVWMREKDAAALTRRVVERGLKHDGEKVWRLAARKGDARFREEVEALVARLDVAVLLRHEDALYRLGQALLGTPLERAGRRLLERACRLAAERPGTLLVRRRILEVLGDVAEEQKLIAGTLAEPAAGGRDYLLMRASELLARAPDAPLLRAALRALEEMADPKPELLEAFLALAPAGEARDALLARRLALVEAEPAPRCALLARLGRFEELETLLGAPAQGEDLERLAWRLRCAVGLGREAQTRAAALDCIEAALRLPPSAPAPTLPGLAAAGPLLGGARGRVEALAQRFGAQALPGQEALLASEPLWILAALDPEAREAPRAQEDALRWRLGRVTRAEVPALRREAEGRLGREHPLVAEMLMAEVAAQEEPDPALLERARGILERARAPLEARAEVQARLAGLHGQEGDEAAAEREGKALLELLEAQDPPSADALASCAIGLGFQYVRQGKLEAVSELIQRLERLLACLPKEGRAAFQKPLRHGKDYLRRAAVLQARLRAAGL